MEGSELKVLPRKVDTTGDTDPWRLAAAAYEAEEWTRGTVLLHDDLKRLMGLPVIDPARVNGEECLRARMEYMRQVENLKAYLLDEHQVLLVSQHAQGYRVVPVEDHVRITTTEARHDLNAALNTLDRRLHNAPVDQMTDAQRREYDDSCARAASIRNNLRKELRGLVPRLPAALPAHEDGSEKN